MADAGLIPLARFADRSGPPARLTEYLQVTGADNHGGGHSGAGAMLLSGVGRAGAGGTDRLRTGAMDALFGWPPCTEGLNALTRQASLRPGTGPSTRRGRSAPHGWSPPEGRRRTRVGQRRRASSIRPPHSPARPR